MTIEEMAEFMAGSDLVPCDECGKISAPQYCDKEFCIYTAEQWLQAESEE